MKWLATVSGAILAFAATNIDDIFVLTLFFAQKHLKSWQVVLGQYIGLAALIAVSLTGFFARLIVPEWLLGWLGVGPLAIGIKKLIELKRHGKESEEVQVRAGSVLMVSAVTFANGGDNIAVYIPLFANSNAVTLVVILLTFAVMIGLWCFVGYFIGRRALVSCLLDRYGHFLVPFVLIALGLYIMLR
jgi:cadmium resistance protein CadD (predicted permease)